MSDLGNKKVFAENLSRYMTEAQKDRMDICEALGLKYSTLTEWLNGKKYPRIDKIEMLANYFGIQKSDLIEDHKKSDTQDDPDIRLIARARKQMSPEDQAKMMSVLKLMFSEEFNEDGSKKNE